MICRHFPAAFLHQAKIINSAQFQQHLRPWEAGLAVHGAEPGPVPKMRCLFIKLPSVYIAGTANKTPKLSCSGSQAIQHPAPHLSSASRKPCWRNLFLAIDNRKAATLMHCGILGVTQMACQILALLKSCWYPLLRGNLIRRLQSVFSHYLNTPKVMAPDLSWQAPISALSFTPL